MLIVPSYLKSIIYTRLITNFSSNAFFLGNLQPCKPATFTDRKREQGVSIYEQDLI